MIVSFYQCIIRLYDLSTKVSCYLFVNYMQHRGGGFGSGFIPIAEYGSEFRKGSRRKAVRLLYSGKNHYDLLV